MKLMEAISLRLIELLEERNISSYRLSLLSGVSEATISDIRLMKNKTVAINVIYELVDGLEMDLPAFFNSPLFQRENITG